MKIHDRCFPIEYYPVEVLIEAEAQRQRQRNYAICYIIKKLRYCRVLIC
jgi:hypothetical protein